MAISRHLTFANVASATALALVLGSGAAVAAGLAPNSVGSKQIKSQAVKSSDIKNNGVKGKDIKESTLGSVPKVDTVVTTPRVTAAVAGPVVTVATRGTFTFTLRCVQSGGNVQSFLEVRTSADNAALDSLNGAEVAELDAFMGPQTIAETSAMDEDVEQASFVAVTPQGKLYQGFGYTSSLLNGSAGCAAQLTFIG